MGNCTCGFLKSIIPKVCDCDRVKKSVGIQNLRQTLGSDGNFDLAGGNWQSFPEKAECTGINTPGDYSGCSYKLMDTVKAINATCLYTTVDEAMYSYNSTCFDNCPDKFNVTSPCVLECFSATVEVCTDE